MKRLHLYMLYAAVWALTIWLFYVAQPQGLGPLMTLFLYGPPVLILYLLTLLFMDVREEIIGSSLFRTFFRHRRPAIGFFAFGMVVLILLLFRS